MITQEDYTDITIYEETYAGQCRGTCTKSFFVIFLFFYFYNRQLNQRCIFVSCLFWTLVAQIPGGALAFSMHTSLKSVRTLEGPPTVQSSAKPEQRDDILPGWYLLKWP